MTSRTRLGLFASMILWLSCRTIPYLPSTDTIPESRFGAHIQFYTTRNNNKVAGELLSVSGDSLVILNEKTDSIEVQLNQPDRRFMITYANPDNYGTIAGILTASTLSHGIFMVISTPVNLAVTGAAAVTAVSDYQLTNRQIKPAELKSFARFPQGMHVNRIRELLK